MFTVFTDCFKLLSILGKYRPRMNGTRDKSHSYGSVHTLCQRWRFCCRWVV